MARKKEEPGFEEKLQRLGVIVDALEAGDCPLEQRVALYKEGLALAASCREQLDSARHDVEIYRQGLLVPFSPESGDGREGEAEDAAQDGAEERACFNPQSPHPPTESAADG